MKTRLHVHQANIRHNRKHGTTRPVLIVRTSREARQTNKTLFLHGPSRLVYSPNKPLPCGARVWIETEGRVGTRPPPKQNADLLVRAARKVVRRWAKGDLAEAVRELDQVLKGMKNETHRQ